MSMIQTKPKSLFRSICVFALLVFLRVIIADKTYTEVGMLCLNTLALDYILLDIFIDAHTCIKRRLNTSALPTKTAIRKLKPLTFGMVILFIIFLGIQFAYISVWANSLTNDILTILALFISIESTALSDCIIAALSKIYGFSKGEHDE